MYPTEERARWKEAQRLRKEQGIEPKRKAKHVEEHYKRFSPAGPNMNYISHHLDLDNVSCSDWTYDKISFCFKVSTLDDDESGVRRLLVPAGSAHIARQTITGEKLSILLNTLIA